MTEAEMKIAAERLAVINGLRSKLETARRNLELVNKHQPQNFDPFNSLSWTVELELAKGRKNSWGAYDKGPTVRIRVPYGVVQQQCVDAVRAAERELIAAGGEP